MVRKLLTSVLISVAVLAVIVLALIYFDAPVFEAANDKDGIQFAEAVKVDYSDLPSSQSFTARDGTALPYRRYDSSTHTNRLIILIHGSAWHGMQFHAMARALAGAGLGTVIAPDMRGHGANPVRRGDVDYIGQLEEDISDLIGHLAKDQDKQQIIMGGHSSGGGFVVRFAGGAHGHKVDAFVLLAPFLKYNAPTTRANSGGWARPAIRRIIGLSMMNLAGIRALNHLPVISFAMPRAVMDGPYGNTVTTIYTYRMNTAFAPRSDYEADLAAINRPLLVIVGDRDEAFIATEFESVISAQTETGSYHIIEGASHMGVVTGAAAIAVLQTWLGDLP